MSIESRYNIPISKYNQVQMSKSETKEEDNTRKLIVGPHVHKDVISSRTQLRCM